jgi:hypothetical protein
MRGRDLELPWERQWLRGKAVLHGDEFAEGVGSRLRGPRKLKVLCVGTGRDGTQSLNHLIEHIFAASGDGRSMHEYACREFNQAFCDLAENGGGDAAGTLERMVAECPHECIVGNGYAAILPLFAKHYGRDLKLVHLCRADRDSCIASLIKNAALFPTAHRYYSASPEATVKRIAAFHFGEMSRAAWDRLTLTEKFAWYYDKTHALVRQHLALFDATIAVETERLDDPATRRSIADFIAGPAAALPPKTHLNAAAIDISSFAQAHRFKMHWLMGRLNLEELATDDVYALEYFLDKFIAWTSYQISAAPQLEGTPPPPAAAIAANLERAVQILNDGLREVEGLRKLAAIRLSERDPAGDG